MTQFNFNSSFTFLEVLLQVYWLLYLQLTHPEIMSNLFLQGSLVVAPDTTADATAACLLFNTTKLPSHAHGVPVVTAAAADSPQQQQSNCTPIAKASQEACMHSRKSIWSEQALLNSSTCREGTALWAQHLHWRW